VAADALKAALLKLATDGNASSKLSGVKPSEAVFRDGQLMAQDDFIAKRIACIACRSRESSLR